MTTKKAANEDVLGMLHNAVAKELLNKITSGTASSAELNCAIKFLKDNCINCVGIEDDTLVALASELPDFISAEDFE